MELVSFISTETGDDLILSFAVQDPDEPSAIESLTLLRTPKYDFILDEGERGIRVSFDRFGDAIYLLEEAIFSAAEQTIRLKTKKHTYDLDLRKLDRKQTDAMCKVLLKMNFDRCVKLSGV